MRWVLSKKASADIDAIIRYTDDAFGAAQTEDYVGGLYRSFDLLLNNPHMGRAWSGERRCIIYRQHYVFYRLRRDDLFITHIRNTRQRLPESWRRD
jgi:plasmid stabilization system protein ParE